MSMITLSVIKADIGSYTGHGEVHPDLIEIAKKELKKSKILIDFYVTNCGDDLELIMTHNKGTDSKQVHELAWDVFMKCTEHAKKLKLYGAGQDILSTAFSGNVKGMGPGVAEMQFEERKSEPVVVFLADKTAPCFMNLPLFRIFADPFNTAGLVIDAKTHVGFKFEVYDIEEGKKIMLNSPEEMYDILALVGVTSRYVIKAVYKKDGEIAATVSTEKLSMMAGEYVGKDDPVAIVRCQSGLPAVGEVIEPFSFPHLVPGFMRGSHYGPIMPVSNKDAHPRRFDGPPRVVALGFQLNNGKLIGPVDMFDDPSYDLARQKSNEISDYMRRHGPFQPHLLGAEDLEYTTLPEVLKKLEKRFTKLPESELKAFRKIKK